MRAPAETAGFLDRLLRLTARPVAHRLATHRPKDAIIVLTARSIALFAVAAVLEIGGCWFVWQGVREHRGLLWIAAGVIALGGYGFVATLQPSSDFGRVLAAYGGVFVAGSLLWGWGVDGYRPDRFDVIGAVICLCGVGVIMYAPRGR